MSADDSNRRRRRIALLRRLWTVLLLLPVAAAMVSGVVTFFAAPPDTPARLSSARGPSNAELRETVLSLSRQVRGLEEQIEGLTAVPEDALVASRLGRLDQTLSGMTERVASLENAILTDPAKAIQVPLLSDQVADLAARTDAALAAQRDAVDRVYDILKFSIGGLAVGILTMALTTVFRPRHEPPS